MTAPTVRRVDQFTGQIIRNPEFPSLCEVCVTGLVWFPTLRERNEWESSHNHGGMD